MQIHISHLFLHLVLPNSPNRYPISPNSSIVIAWVSAVLDDLKTPFVLLTHILFLLLGF